LKRFFAALAAGVLYLGTLHAEQGDAIDRIAAIVDNEIILASEIYQYLQFNIGSQEALARLTDAEEDSLKRLILEDLIDQKVLLAKARADTVQVDARDVDRELDARQDADRSGGWAGTSRRVLRHADRQTQARVSLARGAESADRTDETAEAGQRAGHAQ